jgi:hypothetical protein
MSSSSEVYTQEQLLRILQDYRKQFSTSGDYTFRFSDYTYEIVFGLLGLFLGGYVISLGMTLLGVGIMIVFLVFIMLYYSYKQAKANTPWPPSVSPCPNAFYYNSTASSRPGQTNVVCSPLYPSLNSTNFTYPKGNRSVGCNSALRQGLDWDGC